MYWHIYNKILQIIVTLFLSIFHTKTKAATISFAFHARSISYNSHNALCQHPRMLWETPVGGFLKYLAGYGTRVRGRMCACLVVGGACECVFHFVVIVSTVCVIRKSYAVVAMSCLPCCFQGVKHRRSVRGSHGRAL